MLNFIRYVFALPLSFAALWICWFINVFLWEVFHFLSQPLTTSLLRFELFEKISYVIDTVTFLSFSVPISTIVLYLVLYYTLPKNKTRKNIILIFFILSVILIGHSILSAENGLLLYGNLLCLVVSLCATGYFLEKDNQIFGNNNKSNELLADDTEV